MYIKAITHPHERRSYSRTLEAKDFHVAMQWEEGTVDTPAADHPVISRVDVTVIMFTDHEKEHPIELVLTPQQDHNWDQVYIMNDAGDTIQSISCN